MREHRGTPGLREPAHCRPTAFRRFARLTVRGVIQVGAIRRVRTATSPVDMVAAKGPGQLGLHENRLRAEAAVATLKS